MKAEAITSPVHCHLLLPLDRATLAAAPAMPALAQLLRHAQREQAADEDAGAWLCRRFGVARQQDWPQAAFAALADGLPAEAGYWLHADPVSLVLQRDSFALAECTPQLTPEQARQLVAALNDHFAPDGMRFHCAAPRRWYLQLATATQLRTHPVSQVLGRDIQPWLPQGADGLTWHRWLNELQMLLHAHPINAALEEQRALPVNSVWLWGGGQLSKTQGAADLAVWADDPLTRGLTLAQGARLAPLPSSATAWLPQATDGEALLVLPQESLPNLERDWCAPLLASLRAGRLARLSLHLAGDTICSYTLTRRDLLKFWRRARPLETYLG